MFKVGDRVKCIDPNDCFVKLNHVYIVTSIRPSCRCPDVLITLAGNHGVEYYGHRFIPCKETGMVPHKHAAIIKAWADGAEVQGRRTGKDEWRDLAFPNWRDYAQYRIKPEPLKDIIAYARAEFTDAKDGPVSPGQAKSWTFFSATRAATDNIRATFDAETGNLKKVEVI